MYIFNLTFWLSRKTVVKKIEVNFKIYDVTYWATNDYYARTKGNKTMKFFELIKYKMTKYFLRKPYTTF